MEGLLKKALFGFVVSLIISAIFLGFRASALKSAYDSTNSFTVNDTAGTVHTVAASGVSGDIVALIWSIAAGLVWLVYVVAMAFALVKEIK